MPAHIVGIGDDSAVLSPGKYDELSGFWHIWDAAIRKEHTNPSYQVMETPKSL